MDLPYETVQDMCSSACKLRLFGVYKANRLILQNQREVMAMNDELKKNEVSYSIKLNEAMEEIDLLKRNLLERNVEINLLSERLLLAQFESTKLQTKLDKWTVASMKMNELASKQRGARVKDGVGYDTEVQTVFPPPFTVCYSPTPKPHPKNDLFEQETNSLHAGLEGVNIAEVRDDYDSSTGMGYSKMGTDSQANDCSVPVVSNPVTVVFTNLFDKFKAGEIPIFEPVKNVKKEIVQESPNHQAPITSTHPIPINQDPLEGAVLSEEWTSSDDEPKKKRSQENSKTKTSSETIKIQIPPKSESRRIRISLPDVKQVNSSSKAQQPKSPSPSFISQNLKRTKKRPKLYQQPKSRPLKLHHNHSTAKSRVSTGKSKEMYVFYSDSDSHMSSCDKEICMDRVPAFKNKKTGLKTHCFRCGKADHAVKQCPDFVQQGVNNSSFSNRLNRFVNNHFPVSFSLFKPKPNKAWVPVTN